jgi:hypothetical protein
LHWKADESSFTPKRLAITILTRERATRLSLQHAFQIDGSGLVGPWALNSRSSLGVIPSFIHDLRTRYLTYTSNASVGKGWALRMLHACSPAVNLAHLSVPFAFPAARGFTSDPSESSMNGFVRPIYDFVFLSIHVSFSCKQFVL